MSHFAKVSTAPENEVALLAPQFSEGPVGFGHRLGSMVHRSHCDVMMSDGSEGSLHIANPIWTTISPFQISSSPPKK